MNKYEKAFEQKKEAEKLGYWMRSFIDENNGSCEVGHFGYEDIIHTFVYEDEIEAINSAFVWIKYVDSNPPQKQMSRCS
jgi:hypothetical protein